MWNILIQVEVAFEGNRFSQAISNFGELTIIERENGNGSSQNSDPPLVSSLSSSSRENSPAINQFGVTGRDNSDPSPGRQLGAVGGSTGRGVSPPSLDTALLAIGKVFSPQYSVKHHPIITRPKVQCKTSSDNYAWLLHFTTFVICG